MKADHYHHKASVARAAAPRWPANQVAFVADQAVQDAISIAVDVRTHDPALVFGDLTLRAGQDPARFVAAVVALAALIDVERPVSELLAWTDRLTTA